MQPGNAPPALRLAPTASATNCSARATPLRKPPASAGADLAAQLERLQHDIADIRRTVAGFAETSGAEARGAASRIGGVASEKIDEFADRARKESETIVGELEAYARKNPYQVLAGALGVGVIIGLSLRRR